MRICTVLRLDVGWRSTKGDVVSNDNDGANQQDPGSYGKIPPKPAMPPLPQSPSAGAPPAVPPVPPLPAQPQNPAQQYPAQPYQEQPTQQYPAQPGSQFGQQFQQQPTQQYPQQQYPQQQYPQQPTQQYPQQPTQGLPGYSGDLAYPTYNVQPQFNQNGQPFGQPSGEPPQSQKKRPWLLPTILIGAGVVVAAGVVVVIMMLQPKEDVAKDSDPVTTSQAPTGEQRPEPSDPQKQTPKPEPTKADPKPPASPSPQPTITVKPTPSATPNVSAAPQPAPDDVVITADNIAAEIDGMKSRYKTMVDDGSLWQQMPQTDKNVYAYTALNYFLTDLKAATLFGVDDASAKEYWESAKNYEALFLAQQPLGNDVTIDGDDFYFHYDGTTGEGEYKKK